jgi:hypothetical protein
MPTPQAPPHLQHLVMDTIPPENCAWSLSGPQFPVSNKAGSLQQRYCYPKGRPEYSSYKGGALWTIRGYDGKEENEYRLLHVYQSHKRAANKGVTLAPITTSLSNDYSSYEPVTKKARYISPTRERVLPRYKSPFQDSIHRIASCTTLDTALSFPTLDDGFSHSFESVAHANNNNHQLHRQADNEPICHHDNAHHPGDNQDQLDHDFNFQDLHNDPLLQEMDQRSTEGKLIQRLEIVHEKIRQYIFEQPQHQQASLVSTCAAWARAMAMDPLWIRTTADRVHTYHDGYAPTHGRHHAC